jgi:hypothetical protein
MVEVKRKVDRGGQSEGRCRQREGEGEKSQPRGAAREKRREGSRLERPSGRCDGAVARISSLSELGESRRGKSRRGLKVEAREERKRGENTP